MKNVIGKLFGSLFFLFFLGMGSLFIIFLGRDVYSKAQTYFWAETPCEIQSVEIKDISAQARDQPYFIEVEYTYIYEGQSYQSDLFTLSSKGYSQYDTLARYKADLQKDTQIKCYVNPSRPEQAILKREAFWHGLFVFIPLIFVVIGVAGIVGVWKDSSEGTRPKTESTRSLTNKETAGQRFVVVFFLIFFLIGAGCAYGLFFRPLIKIIQAKNWEYLDCEIISSRVRSHYSSDGTTYSIDILYSYEYNGDAFQSNRYDFFGGSSSGHSGKQGIVSRYPQGSTQKCYVNPHDPQEAVLSRKMSGAMYAGGAIGLVFALFGGIGAVNVLRAPAVKGKDQKASFITEDVPETKIFSEMIPEADGSLILKPTTTPMARFITALIFTLIWNGVLLGIVYHKFPAEGPDLGDWISALLSFPAVIFAVIGLLIVFGAIYQFLVLFNPRPEIRLYTKDLRLGGEISLQWSLAGRCNRVESFNLFLEGREVAIYTRGTSTYTDKSVFYSNNFISTHDRVGMKQGETKVKIPLKTMHSFSSTHNRIEWYFRIEGIINRWPDVKEEFAIIIHPLDREALKGKT